MRRAWDEAPRLGRRDGFYDDLEIVAYLNHAAMTPPSRPVRAAMVSAAEAHARRGLGAIATWRGQRAQLREDLAELIGAESADQIALAPNTSTAVVHLALSMSWCPGDVVLLGEGEFPANVTPWQRVAETFDLRLVYLPAPRAEAFDAWWAAFAEALERHRPRIFAVSAVQFQTGLRMPLRRMSKACRDVGTELFVDAIQACGVVPVDVSGVDYLVAGGHKWLTGPEGTGFLYVDPERMTSLVPRVAGWLSHEDPLAFLIRGAGHLHHDRPLRRRVDAFELGTPNTMGAAGLGVAVQTILALDVTRIYAHVQAYLDRLERELLDLGFRSLRAREPELRSGALSLLPPDGVDLVTLARAIDRRVVSCGTPDGLLRFAPHWPNDLEAELGSVLFAIEAALTAQ